MATPNLDDRLNDFAQTQETFQSFIRTLPAEKARRAQAAARTLLDFWSRLNEDGLSPADVVVVAQYASDTAQHALDVARAGVAAMLQLREVR